MRITRIHPGKVGFTLIELLACPPKPPGRRRVQSAFTLIELLVVIAIISILISLVSPSLSGARARGESARCASQLREIARALHIYGIDHNGYLTGRLYYYPLDPYASRYSLAPYLDVPRAMRQTTIFTCSALHAKWPYHTSWGRTRAINHFGYAWMPAVSSDSIGEQILARKPTMLMEIPSPSQMFFISDSVYFIFHSDHAGWAYYSEITRNRFAEAPAERFVHQDGLNFSFMDGHVRTLSRNEILLRAGDAADPLWQGGF